MKLSAKIIVSLTLLSLAGCVPVPPPGRWEKLAVDREAKKFATRPDKARLYIYSALLKDHQFCPAPVISSEGSAANSGFSKVPNASYFLPNDKNQFSIIYTNAALCYNEYVVVDINPGVAFSGFGDCPIEFNAEAGEIYYIRYYSKYSVFKREDMKRGRFKTETDVYLDFCMELMESDKAQTQIKRNMRLVVLKPEFWPKKR